MGRTEPELPESDREIEDWGDFERLPQAVNENIDEGDTRDDTNELPEEESLESSGIEAADVENTKENVSNLSNDGEELREDISEQEMGGDDGQSDEQNSTVEATRSIEDTIENQQEAPESIGLTPHSGIGGSVAVQAVTLLFYLLAFLVILQRFWVYVGRYILI